MPPPALLPVPLRAPTNGYLSDLQASLVAQLELVQKELASGCEIARRCRDAQENTFCQLVHGGLPQQPEKQVDKTFALMSPIWCNTYAPSSQPLMSQAMQPRDDSVPPLPAADSNTTPIKRYSYGSASLQLSFSSSFPPRADEHKASACSLKSVGFQQEDDHLKSPTHQNRAGSTQLSHVESLDRSLPLNGGFHHGQTSMGMRSEEASKVWPATLKIRDELVSLPGADIRWMLSFAQCNESRERSSKDIQRGTTFSNSPHGQGASPGWRAAATGITEATRRSRMHVCSGSFMIAPSSRMRQIIDMLGLAVLMFDFIATPYTIAWYPRRAPAEMAIASKVSTLFWASEAVSNFFTGFYDPKTGEVVLILRDTSWSYFKSWFVFDFTLLCVAMIAHALDDWNMTVAMGGINGLRLAKARPFFKAWSMARVIRLDFDKICSPQVSDKIRLSVTVIKICVLLLIVSHTMCCAYFCISHWSYTDTGHHWLQFRLEGLPTLESRNTLYQYCTVLHWAMAQITAAPMEYFPLNTAERLYTIVCQTFGLIFGSYLVAVVSTAMIELQQSRQDQTAQLSKLHRFMRQHDLTRSTAAKVSRQAKQRLARPAELSLQELKDLPVLKLLSERLRSVVLYEALEQYVLYHPLFRLWGLIDEGTLHRLCTEAVDLRILSAGDRLFISGETAHAAYFVIKGHIAYTRDDNFIALQTSEKRMVKGTASKSILARHKSFKSSTSEFRDVGDAETSIKDGAWLAEMALWIYWFHVGRAEAADDSKIVTLCPEILATLVAKSMLVKDLTQEYANAFHGLVSVSRPPHWTYPDDTGVQCADYADVVALMNDPVRRLIAEFAIREVNNDNFYLHFPVSSGRRSTRRSRRGSLEQAGRKSSQKHPSSRNKLDEEVADGRCVVIQDGSGDVHRVVHIAVLSLRNEDDELLVRLAMYFADESHMDHKGHLPAKKLERGQSAADAILLLMSSELAPLRQCVEFQGIVREIEWKFSQAVHFRTKYVRNLIEARINDVLPDFRRLVPTDDEHIEQPFEMFAIQVDHSRHDIYAWLPSDTYEFLRSGSKEAHAKLEAWLAKIDTSCFHTRSNSTLDSHITEGKSHPGVEMTPASSSGSKSAVRWNVRRSMSAGRSASIDKYLEASETEALDDDGGEAHPRTWSFMYPFSRFRSRTMRYSR